MAHPGWAMGFRAGRRPTNLLDKAVRRAAVVPVAAGLLLGVAACSGSSNQDDARNPGVPGASSRAASAAPPGRYRLLPEPCGSVTQATLDKVLPGAASGTEQDARARAQESTSASPGGPSASPSAGQGGKATLTFDTDRRAGCEWHVKDATWTRRLHVDFERVVSYDTRVSDDQQARDEYLDSVFRAEKSGNPTHAVAGIGDDAFSSEKATTDGSRPHRQVTLVFRKDNVMVTVEYGDWPQGGAAGQPSAAVQEGARLVAQDLVRRLAQE
jgi:hypothetical protein